MPKSTMSTLLVTFSEIRGWKGSVGRGPAQFRQDTCTIRRDLATRPASPTLATGEGGKKYAEKATPELTALDQREI
ncbi:hypothetical protein N7522_005296 [Penicillium canescens]|nr:hypothetical protein N7522_005296 [Penicillium canescens]